MPRGVRSYAERRVETLVRVFDEFASVGEPISAYRLAPRIGFHRRNAWRYASALVTARCLKLVQFNGRAIAYAVLVSRDVALDRIAKFAAGGIHKRKRRPSERNRFVAQATVARLRDPACSGISTRYAGLGLFDDEQG